MSAATLPHPSLTSAPSWTPSPKDRLAYRWVKLEGLTQSWVAQQLDLHQSTVSRMITRYERWVAHGGPAQAGALNHEEQLRYHRWLTYERNEVIIASSLRLADEMQRSLDTSKSTTIYPAGDPLQETRVRTEHLAIDRSGAACRYLRLAFRVNMEQHKLVEQDELSPLAPLSAADLDPSLDDDIQRESAEYRARNYHSNDPTITPFPEANQNRDTQENPSLAPSHIPTLLPIPTPTPIPTPDLAPDLPLAAPAPTSFPGSSLGIPSPEAPASPPDVNAPIAEAPPAPSPQPPLLPTPYSLLPTAGPTPMLSLHKTHTPPLINSFLTPGPTNASNNFPPQSFFVESEPPLVQLKAESLFPPLQGHAFLDVAEPHKPAVQAKKFNLAPPPALNSTNSPP